MDSILGQILDQPAWLVYLIVGLVVFVEDALFVGFVVPGETVAVLGGVTASLGTTNVWLIGLIVVAAAVLGDSVGYEIGRVWGTQIIARPFFDKRRQRLDQAQAFLRERTADQPADPGDERRDKQKPDSPKTSSGHSRKP